MPRADSTSAAPLFDETALLPCFATGIPAPAITKAVAVEILKVPIPSPPVPTISTASCGGVMVSARCLKTAAPAAISSGVSPRIFSPTLNAAIWAGLALPSIISPKAILISSKDRAVPSIICWVMAVRRSDMNLLRKFFIKFEKLRL